MANTILKLVPKKEHEQNIKSESMVSVLEELLVQIKNNEISDLCLVWSETGMMPMFYACCDNRGYVALAGNVCQQKSLDPDL